MIPNFKIQYQVVEGGTVYEVHEYAETARKAIELFLKVEDCPDIVMVRAESL